MQAKTIEIIVGSDKEEIAARSGASHEVEFGGEEEKGAVALVGDGASVVVEVRSRATSRS